jgi:hypothetical protein
VFVGNLSIEKFWRVRNPKKPWVIEEKLLTAKDAKKNREGRKENLDQARFRQDGLRYTDGEHREIGHQSLLELGASARARFAHPKFW